MEDLDESSSFSLQEPRRKQLLRVQFPYVLRFSLIWVIFFSIMGIILQSIEVGKLVFSDFFVGNYIAWFKSFGTFTQQAVYSSVEEVFFAILGEWYYFFVTGGLIALLWGLISWIINFEIVFTRRKKPIPNLSLETFPIQESSLENPQKQISNPLPSPGSQEQDKQDENLEKINEWLSEGLLMLSEGNLEEAELIYEGLRKEYNPENDAYGVLQRRILSFYGEIIAEKANREKK